MGEKLTFDPIIPFPKNGASSSTGATFDNNRAPLEIGGPNVRILGTGLQEHDYSVGEDLAILVGSIDTEGERKLVAAARNRRITIKALLFEPDADAGKNLAMNAQFEYKPGGSDIPNWWIDTGTATTKARVTEGGPGIGRAGVFGDGCLRVTSGAASVSGVLQQQRNVTSVQVASLGQHTVSMYLQGLVGGEQVEIGMRCVNSGGTLVSGGALSGTTLTLSTGWQRFSFTSALPAGTVYALPFVRSVNASQPTFFVDGVQVEAGSVATPFMDGNFPGHKYLDSNTRGETASYRYGKGGDRIQQILFDLEAKIARLNAEGGVLRRTLKNGDEICFDVVEARLSGNIENPRAWVGGVHPVEIELMCLPFGRGAEVTVPVTADMSETATPALTFVIDQVLGDVPALGRLVVLANDTEDQNFLAWGVESRQFTDSADALLFYEAESRTPMSNAVVASLAPTSNFEASPDGSSANNIVSCALGEGQWDPILSTQASGGNHLVHVGSYRVWARVKGTGGVALKLAYAVGDFSRTAETPEVNYPNPQSGNFVWLDLGQVHIDKQPKGTHRWRAILYGKANSGTQTLQIDCIGLQPISEYSGQVRVAPSTDLPQSYQMKDTVGVNADAVNISAAPNGIATPSSPQCRWDEGAAGPSPSGSDLTAFISGSRPTTPGQVGSVGRFSVMGETSTWDKTTIMMGVEFNPVGFPNGYDFVPRVGLLRLKDFQNWAWIGMRESPTGNHARGTVFSRVNATSNQLVGGPTQSPITVMGSDSWVRMMALFHANGNYALWWGPSWDLLGLVMSGNLTELKSSNPSTGLGRVGIYHRNTASSQNTGFRNFWAATPVVDGVALSGQSVEIHHDRVMREDVGGTMYTPLTMEGDYCRLPASGREMRKSQLFIMTAVTEQPSLPSNFIHDTSAELYYTPRYLLVPEPD